MKLLASAIILVAFFPIACGTQHPIIMGSHYDHAIRGMLEEAVIDCDAFARRHPAARAEQGAMPVVGSAGLSPNDVVIATALRWRLKVREAYQATMTHCMEQQGYHMELAED